MNPVVWFVAGAASGVYGLVKARRAADNLTPDGLAARRESWRAGAREFRNQVAEGSAARETELREQLQLPQPGAADRALGPGRRAISPGHGEAPPQHEITTSRAEKEATSDEDR